MINKKNNKLEKFLEIKKKIDLINILLFRIASASDIPGRKPEVTIRVNERDELLKLEDPSDLINLLKKRIDNLKLELIESYNDMDIENEVHDYFEL